MKKVNYYKYYFFWCHWERNIQWTSFVAEFFNSKREKFTLNILFLYFKSNHLTKIKMYSTLIRRK